MATEAAQGNSVQFFDLLQHVEVAVSGMQIEIVGSAAELQVQIQQQSGITHAELVRQIAGQQGCSGAALGVDHGYQLSTACRTRAGLLHHTAQCGTQVLLGHRLRKEVTGAGLHCQAYALALLKRPAQQQRWPFMDGTLLQCGQFFAPQVADPQQQQIRRLL